jgi:lactoylglutathione lyase
MRFLHTRIRVNNLDESLRFYCDVLGMKLIEKETTHRQVHPRFGAIGDEAQTRERMTYNWETHHYDLGNAFGHLALGVEDIHKTCAKSYAAGAQSRS